MEGLQVAVQEFETGAIRDVKETPSSWEKFSLPALMAVADSCATEEGSFERHCNTQPLELVDKAIMSVYDYISSSDPVDKRDHHLVLAFRHLMYAYELKMLSVGQIKEILAMRAVIGDQSCNKNLHLLGYNTLKRLAETRYEGGVKYGSWNWINGFPIMSVLSHAVEHMFAICGAMYDEDHWGHAFCNLMFAIHFTIFRKDMIHGQLGQDYTLTDEIRKELKEHQALREKAKHEQRLRESTVRRTRESAEASPVGGWADNQAIRRSDADDNGDGCGRESKNRAQPKKPAPKRRKRS